MSMMDKDRDDSSEAEIYDLHAAVDNDHDDEAAAESLRENVRLALEDDDNDRLPWLDSDDDYEGEGNDNGRMLGLVIMGLVALATIVGGIWWATHRTPDETLVADGSTIAAPAEPYKQAPKDPGGKTFDGTGNTAFAVSEGQTRPARLGEASNAPTAAPSPAGPAVKPGFDIGKPASSDAPAGPAAASGTMVQVGAYSSRASAEAAWGRLSQQYSALSGLRHQAVEGKSDIGTVFRLQALPGDAAGAQALCGRLKSAGLSCQVK